MKRQRTPRARAARKSTKRAEIPVVILGGDLELVAKCLDQLSTQLVGVELVVALLRQRRAVREYLTPYLASIRPIISKILGTEEHNGIALDHPKHPRFLAASEAERAEEFVVDMAPIPLALVLAEPSLKASVAAMEVLVEYGLLADV